MTSIIRVSDAKTGKLKRFESEGGHALAVVKNGRLQLTTLGKDRGYQVRGNKLLVAKSGYEAY